MQSARAPQPPPHSKAYCPPPPPTPETPRRCTARATPCARPTAPSRWPGTFATRRARAARACCRCWPRGGAPSTQHFCRQKCGTLARTPQVRVHHYWRAVVACCSLCPAPPPGPAPQLLLLLPGAATWSWVNLLCLCHHAPQQRRTGGGGTRCGGPLVACACARWMSWWAPCLMWMTTGTSCLAGAASPPSKPVSALQGCGGACVLGCVGVRRVAWAPARRAPRRSAGGSLLLLQPPTLSGPPAHRAAAAETLRAKGMLPAIWFIFSRRDCDVAAAHLASQGVSFTTPEGACACMRARSHARPVTAPARQHASDGCIVRRPHPVPTPANAFAPTLRLGTQSAWLCRQRWTR